MARTGNGNGCKSNGAKTRQGKLTILSAKVVDGSRCWSPVLPAIEREEDWQARLAAVTASLQPGSYLEEQLAYQAALSLQQWDRLHRFEKAQTAHQMEEVVNDPFSEHREAAHTVLEAGLVAIKAQLSSVTRLIELLQILPVADPAKPIQPADGRLLLMSAATWCAKGAAPTGQPFTEPPQWTWGVVIEGLSELAADCGKSVQRLLESLGEWALSRHQHLSSTLSHGTPVLERALVHEGSALVHEYHTKVLGRLIKILGLYGQAQSARLGTNIIAPAADGLVHLVNGEDDV
jgi:hypothetical protein